MRSFLKRACDFCLALAGIVLSSPLWVVFALIIKLCDRGPVFYIQERVGKSGKVFKVLKFRTMYNNSQNLMPATQLLRYSALDELPQLINILKGDMSFVGPRPLIQDEMELMKQEKLYQERLSIQPGLTGTAQLLLPKTATVKEKLLFDIWYIRNYDIMLDIKLILLSYAITFLGRWEQSGDKLMVLGSLRDKVIREIGHEG